MTAVDGFAWPDGFARVPDEAWTEADVDSLALDYDTLERHGWYANLNPTVSDVLSAADDGDIVLDYSGGTGILADRILRAAGAAAFGIVVVDSSRKFLRLAVEKLGADPRVGFRLIRYLKDEGRLQYVDEVLGPLAGRGADALVSTNAVHLYYGLEDTVRSWVRALRPSAPVFVQSGNIGHEPETKGAWIIDETVGAIAQAAEAIVRDDDRWAAYRRVLDDEGTMEAHRELRNKYFLPVRPLSHYVDTFEAAGLEVEEVRHRSIPVDVAEWLEFLQVYHAGILGWVGGVERVEGKPPTDDAVEDRLALLEAAMHDVFDDDEFAAEWTYITCRTPA